MFSGKSLDKREAGTGVDSLDATKMAAYVQDGGWRTSGGGNLTTGASGATTSGALLGGCQKFTNIRFGSIDYPSFGTGLYSCDEI